MKVSEDIRKIDLEKELRICPNCNYELGFHCSFLPEGKACKIILICPNCGTRYDAGWKM
jgi:hypothetical protein